MTDFSFLDDYEFADLIDLKNEVVERIERIERVREEAIAQLRRDMLERASQLDINPQALFVVVPEKDPGEKPAKKALPAKYRDPETGKTWSGKGKRPGWFDSERIHEFRI